MSPVIHVPGPLRTHPAEPSEIEVDASTVSGALAELARLSPNAAPYLLDAQGQVRTFVNIYVNQDDIRVLDGLSTRLGPHDEVIILPAIAGGVATLTSRPA
jgi:adenylyltransferase/sulfurtransferase